MTATLAFEPTFTDNCTASGLITVTLTSDITTVDPPGSSAYVRVRTWTGNDGCGNEATFSQVVTITGGVKAPTPYCYNGLSVAVMPTNGSVVLWANDFDAGSFDDCDDDLTLTIVPEIDAEGLSQDEAYDFSFTGVQQPNGDYGWEFNCDYIADGLSAIIEVRIYVTDDFGNWDYCTASLRLDDNFDACEDQPGTVTYEVSGDLKTEEGIEVFNTIVTIEASYPEFPLVEMVDGYYGFDLAEFVDYSVIQVRNDDHLNGVSTLDIVLIQKHILGLDLLSSPYKLIAADVNNDCKVSGADLIQIRKLILGKYENDEFPSNTSWRFVESEFEFPNPDQPCDFSEIAEIYNLSADEERSFVGVKIGDVNVTAKANAIAEAEVRDWKEIKMLIEDRELETGKRYTVPVMAKDFKDVYGLQWTINLADVKYITIEPGALNIQPQHIGNLNDQTIVMSYNETRGISVEDEEVLFYVVVEALNDNVLSSVLTSSSTVISNEVYIGSELDVHEAVFEFTTRENTIVNEFNLFQNDPNPFKEQTTISFELPKSAEATLSIYDLQGKEIYTKIDGYAKGLNSVNINRNELNSTGVLYYKVQSVDFVATMKMIVID